MLIGLDRGHFFLITRALLVIKRAWLPDADWLSAPALSWFSASNRNASCLSFLLQTGTHRVWVCSKRGYFIITSKKIDLQQKAVFWWRTKRFFHPKMCWLAAWNEDWVGTAIVAQSTELQNFMAAKLKGNFFVLLRVAFNISITSHLIGVKKNSINFVGT